jgi:tRNA nucleotidyltransferase (CCA-adding enzyme)
MTPGRAPAEVPAGALRIAGTLRSAGHEAHLVGGCVRDVVRGLCPSDWDLATDATPERMLALFDGARYENRFGTVVVAQDDDIFEVTAWRREGTYSDHRRPDAVVPAESLVDDLARRDFTVNAMALAIDGVGLVGSSVDAALVDPFGGRADLAGRVIRAVGDPLERFGEDALRMLRAVRFVATLEFDLDPSTYAAIASAAPLVEHVSGERVATEMVKLLAAPTPSRGLAPLESSGLLVAIAPDLGRQRGIPQAKIPGDDLWDHTRRTVDAARCPLPGETLYERALLRLAALVHDIGKPATFSDGHFHGHEQVGADLAADWLGGLHLPRSTIERVVDLVRNHMFAYDPGWSDAAVRRFIRRVGVGALEDLLDLRAADNVGSGQAADVNGLEDLRARCRAQLSSRVALSRGGLDVDGTDLMNALSIERGPRVGALLDALLERVIADPMLNERPRLLALARDLLAAGDPGGEAVDGTEAE